MEEAASTLNIDGREKRPDEPPASAESCHAINDLPERKSGVAEARKYRRRAQAAERELSQARTDLEKLEKRLEERDHEYLALRQTVEIERALRHHAVVDLGLARHLVASQLQDPSPTGGGIQEAVARLLKTHPQLFAPQPASSGVMSATSSDRASHDLRLDHVAAQARHTGHLHDVLRYQQIKRRMLR